MQQAELEACANALRMGKLAVFPTDTVYGIGVSVLHASGPRAIYEAKQRDEGKPVAWLVDGPEALRRFASDVPEAAFELARASWPGGLTIIVKASDAVPEPFRSSAGTIGLRMPANETVLALMRAIGCPLAASSANLSGEAAPRTFDSINPALLAKVAFAIQDDEPRSGVASTVVDCSQGTISVIRQGEVKVAACKS